MGVRGMGKATPQLPHQREKATQMIISGLVLLIVGVLAGISILTTIGMILMVAGAILWLLGSTGRAVGGRPHYW